MSIADLVTKLIGAGAPPDVAAVVVAEAFAEGVRSVEIPRTSVDETAERRRAKDRDRKRLQRENLRKSAECPQKSQPALNLSLPQQDKSIDEGKKVRARKRSASELSADWQPSESHFEAAQRLGFSQQSMNDKAEDMRLWAKSTGAMKVDWDATFHGFLRRDAKQNHRGRNGQTAPNRFAQALEQLGRSVEADRGESGSAEAPRLLSHG